MVATRLGLCLSVVRVTGIVPDLFAGPGGWDEGVRPFRLNTVGIEWDHAACLTAMAAGHQRVRADVAQLPTEPMKGRITGLIASPPCTLFSSAGHGTGTRVINELRQGVVDLMRGADTRSVIRRHIGVVTLAERTAANERRKDATKWSDERVTDTARSDAYTAALVLEPARYITDLRPEWIALEQVPEVYPIWQTYAQELQRDGYSAWCGVLNSADYGVPQTRRRAILIASRVRRVAPPEPTHAEDGNGTDDLFGGSRQPWVTMAQALGWGVASKPAGTLVAGDASKHGRNPLDGDTRAREFYTNARDAGDWQYVASTQANAARRNLNQPAPTVMFGHSSNDVRWVLQERQKWALTQFATTIVASFCPEIVAAPRYRVVGSRQNVEGSMQVSVQEAAILQSFPSDYPWRGSKTKRFEQVGNAIPPLLAQHVVAAATGLPVGAL